jgi:pimeloyl-ACP methyl ester carboxylesterase
MRAMLENRATPVLAAEPPPHGDVAHDGAQAHPESEEDHPAAADIVPEARPLGPPRKCVGIPGGIVVSYFDQGIGPPILFLHGFPTSCALWRKTVAHLAQSHRCIAPDLLGFGDTDGPIENDYGIEAQAARAVAFLDAIGISQEVTVVGHDWGGAIAQALVARAPERIGRLVLIDCPAFEADEPVVLLRIALLARFPFLWDLAADTGLLLWIAKSARGLRGGAFETDAIDDAAIEEYMRPLSKDTPPTYRAGRERLRRVILGTVAGLDAALGRAAAALGKLEKPTLVIWGCDDPYLSVSWGKRLADTIPGCVGFELLPFCGHWVPEEKPAELAGLIAAHQGHGMPLTPPSVPAEAAPGETSAPSSGASPALEALFGGLTRGA